MTDRQDWIPSAQRMEVVRFTADRVARHPGRLIACRDLYAAYCDWCDDGMPLPAESFADAFGLRHQRRDSADGTPCWADVVLRTPAW